MGFRDSIENMIWRENIILQFWREDVLAVRREKYDFLIWQKNEFVVVGQNMIYIIIICLSKTKI